MTKTILKRKVTILKQGTHYNVLIDGKFHAMYPDAFSEKEIFADVRNTIQRNMNDGTESIEIVLRKDCS